MVVKFKTKYEIDGNTLTCSNIDKLVQRLPNIIVSHKLICNSDKSKIIPTRS